jgi:hypothetical protein
MPNVGMLECWNAGMLECWNGARTKHVLIVVTFAACLGALTDGCQWPTALFQHSNIPAFGICHDAPTVPAYG